MMNRFTLALTTLSALPTIAAAQHVYLQDLDLGVSTYASSAEPYSNAGGFQSADNFTLSEDTSIVGVSWWGQSAGFVYADLTNFTSFLIEIYTGDTLPEGGPIFSQTFATDQTNATDTGLLGSNDAIIFGHDVTFDQQVALNAGTQYWLSISVFHDELPFPGERWNWSGSTFIDGSAGFGFFNEAWQTNPTDRAFGLLVPAPGAGAGLAAAALLAARRRR